MASTLCTAVEKDRKRTCSARLASISLGAEMTHSSGTGASAFVYAWIWNEPE